jgi:hypothetical protein
MQLSSKQRDPDAALAGSCQIRPLQELQAADSWDHDANRASVQFLS